MRELLAKSVDELSARIYSRLVLGGELYDSRFSQEPHDIFIDAWKNGDNDFRARIEQATRQVIVKVISEQSRISWSLVRMVEYFRDRQSWPLIMSLVRDCQHRDCRYDGTHVDHQRYLTALASIQPEDDTLETFWKDQIDIVIQNQGSSVCARIALTGLCHINFRLAVKLLPKVASYIMDRAEGDRVNWFVLFLGLIYSGPDFENQAEAVWSGLPAAAQNETSRTAFEEVIMMDQERAKQTPPA